MHGTERIGVTGTAAWVRLLFWTLALGLWTLLLYSRTLAYPFHFDDLVQIADNPSIRLSELSLRGLFRAGTEGTYPARPIAGMTFAFNYYLGRLDPTGYHVFNIVVHLVASAGVVAVTWKATGNHSLAGQSGYRHRAAMAIVAGSLWAVHPAQTQAVTYVVQRMASLAAMFAIWAAYFLLIAMERKGLARWLALGASAGLGVLGLASKETAFVFPAVAALGLVLHITSNKRWGRAAALAAVVVGPTLLAFVVGGDRVWNLVAGSVAGGEAVRLLVVPRAFWFAISIFVLPLPGRLSLEHYFAPTEGLLQPPSTAISLVALTILLFFAWQLLRRNLLAGLAVSWFIILTLAEPAIVVHEPFMEHRLYLASMGLCIAAALAWGRFRDRSTRGAWLVFVAIAALLSGGTWVRNQVWQSPLVLWQDAASKAPEKIRARTNAIIVLVETGQSEQAQRDYRVVREQLVPTTEQDKVAMAAAALAVKEYTDTVRFAESALVSNPALCDRPRRLLAEALYALGNAGAALEQATIVQKCIAVVAEVELARNLESRIRAEQRTQNGEAASAFMKATQMMSLGRFEEARALFERVLVLEPDNAPAWSNWGYCELDLGNYAAAEEYQKRALAIAPGLPTAHFGLGLVQKATGRRQDAHRSFNRYLELASPTDAYRPIAQRHIRELLLP